MKEFHASGTLHKGFQGFIEYAVYLTTAPNQIRIAFSFDKRSLIDGQDAFFDECRTLMQKAFPDRQLDESAKALLLRLIKTELQVSVFYGDLCLGAAWRDETNKEIVISEAESSPGFIMWKPQPGMLRVVVQAVCVLNDNTVYHLSVGGE